MRKACKILEKGLFEKLSSFEERINSMILEGWKPVSITNGHSNMVVLLIKE